MSRQAKAPRQLSTWTRFSLLRLQSDRTETLLQGSLEGVAGVGGPGIRGSGAHGLVDGAVLHGVDGAVRHGHSPKYQEEGRE